MLEQTPQVINSCPILSLVTQQIVGSFIGALTMVLTMITSGIVYKAINSRRAKAASPGTAYDATVQAAKKWINANVKSSQ